MQKRSTKVRYSIIINTLAIIFGIVSGLVIAIILVLIAIVISFGPQQIVLPFIPFSSPYLRYMYAAIFLGVYSILLPITESGFYLVFQSNMWEGVLGDIIISLSYGLLNFVGFVFVIRGSGGIFWSILLGVICALLMYLYVFMREKYSFLYATGIRIGVGVGVGLYVVFMIINNDQHIVDIQTPKYFFGSDTENILYKYIFSSN